MSRDGQLVGVGIATVTVAVVTYLPLSGSLDRYSLRGLIRLVADVRSALNSACAFLAPVIVDVEERPRRLNEHGVSRLYAPVGELADG